MSAYVIDQPELATIPVKGSDAVFPIRRIYCIGRNYAAHTIEMGGDPNREEPFFFQKNAQNADPSGEFPYPPESQDVHHEVEMVVALKGGGKNIAVADALNYVYGYGVGIDMTRRDLQSVAKDQRRPWEPGKAFERSAPMSAIVPASDIGHPDLGQIMLSVNGEMRQQGDLGQMIWKVAEQIAYLSRFYDIAAGDVIMSGTPSGVGPVQKGDVIHCVIAGVGEMTTTVV
ncbi:MAG: fumarylacetoacetate hydrolase family protein [Proteobacteria bacterium]|jgi:fumarylpyruvate hydrolase|nr:fumarylacetoacetate hydrolase family protein [Pseudomonadota bacterium]